jgi:branched-chain amino acid transport system substrate-binding protein
MRKSLVRALGALAATMLLSTTAHAEDTFKIGLIVPLTGPFASIGRQVENGVKLYMQEHGDTVAGHKVEVIVQDDTGTPDVSKRIAQEMLVKDKVDALAGFGLTPLALASAPLATQAKKPMIVMAAATAIITEQSPYIVRTSFTLPQVTLGIAQWAAKNGIKKAVTLVSDYGPGHDAAKTFKEVFTANGGEVVEELAVPLANPDFAPFMQRVLADKPDALFAFVPTGLGSAFMKQYVDRGLAQAGIKLIATGDVLDDENLNQTGDVALGLITSHHYSAAHDSAMNKAFVPAFKKISGGIRPTFMGLGGYDGMHALYAALEKTGGNKDGTKLVEAMKGMSWESPRGMISIDPDTRDIIQDVYIREVKRLADGELYNVEFDRIPQVKDPVKAAKK